MASFAGKRSANLAVEVHPALSQTGAGRDHSPIAPGVLATSVEHDYLVFGERCDTPSGCLEVIQQDDSRDSGIRLELVGVHDPRQVGDLNSPPGHWTGDSKAGSLAAAIL